MTHQVDQAVVEVVSLREVHPAEVSPEVVQVVVDEDSLAVVEVVDEAGTDRCLFRPTRAEYDNVRDRDRNPHKPNPKNTFATRRSPIWDWGQPFFSLLPLFSSFGTFPPRFIRATIILFFLPSTPFLMHIPVYLDVYHISILLIIE